jgi:hypothetical protein
MDNQQHTTHIIPTSTSPKRKLAFQFMPLLPPASPSPSPSPSLGSPTSSTELEETVEHRHSPSSSNEEEGAETARKSEACSQGVAVASIVKISLIKPEPPIKNAETGAVPSRATLFVTSSQNQQQQHDGVAACSTKGKKFAFPTSIHSYVDHEIDADHDHEHEHEHDVEHDTDTDFSTLHDESDRASTVHEDYDEHDHHHYHEGGEDESIEHDERRDKVDEEYEEPDEPEEPDLTSLSSSTSRSVTKTVQDIGADADADARVPKEAEGAEEVGLMRAPETMRSVDDAVQEASTGKISPLPSQGSDAEPKNGLVGELRDADVVMEPTREAGGDSGDGDSTVASPSSPQARTTPSLPPISPKGSSAISSSSANKVASATVPLVSLSMSHSPGSCSPSPGLYSSSSSAIARGGAALGSQRGGVVRC